jgi:hypothetical protein
MNLRHILEYEDHEIRDLLGDLETVGHADKKSFALWVYVPGFYFSTGYRGKLQILVALGDPFYGRGSLESDKPRMLKALQEGRFHRPHKAGLDWKTLEGEPNPQRPERLRSQETIKFLDGPSLAQFFSQERDLDTALMKLKTRISEIMSYEFSPSSAYYEGPVGIVYGRPGDEDLQISPSESFRQSIFDKGNVFYEDLENTKEPRTFPFA